MQENKREPVSRSLLITLVAAVASCASCASLGDFFAGIDDACIAGKLSTAGANTLNTQPGLLDRHSDYQRPIKKGDRVLNGDCSEAVKAASGAVSDAVDK